MFTNTLAADENVKHIHSGILFGYKEEIMKFTDRWKKTRKNIERTHAGSER